MKDEILVQKWLNGQLNEAEKEAFQKLPDAEYNQQILAYANNFKASHFDTVADFETFKKQYNSHKKPIKKLYWQNPFLRIAAVLAIAFGVYFVIFNNSLEKIETAAGEKISVILPDQSEVVLNALSTLKYNSEKWTENRTLKLSGEAYFKVAKGEKFDVVTKSGVVTVVGTQFNVKQRLGFFEVKCFEGIVKVSADTITRLLHPGDTYRMLGNNFSEGKTTNISPKWVANISDFEAVPFSEVLAEIERQYGVSIINSNIDTERLFTGRFVHDNLENALLSITQPMNLTFELEASNQVVIREKNK